MIYNAYIRVIRSYHENPDIKFKKKKLILNQRPWSSDE